MRLTCPNCAAQYEVDATLIPDEGRDVQCSNCGKTWFELPPAADATDEPPAAVVAAPAADPPAAPPGDEGAEEDWSEDAETSGEDAVETTAEIEPTDTPPAPKPDAMPKRREVDPQALDILKEEADRELARRRQDRASTVETQPEFDLVTGGDDTPSRALRARMARLRGESEPRSVARPEPEDDGYHPPQRELLPDIDEINSSLRPADADPDATEVERRRGFRRGFGTMVAIAALLILAYVAAPAIVRALPGLEPLMAAYVEAANGLRDFVDGMLAPSDTS